MDLLDRYLQAVKFWLPKVQRDDIVAELSEDIRSHIEEKETELGRKLNEVEVGTILKGRGRPVLVANRYLAQEHLIGPAFFPIYRFGAALYFVQIRHPGGNQRRQRFSRQNSGDHQDNQPVDVESPPFRGGCRVGDTRFRRIQDHPR